MTVEHLFNMTLGQLESFERLEEERDATMMDEKFQQWAREFKVSSRYFNKEGIHKANELNNQYVDLIKRLQKIIAR